jgi:hypothetical protein
MKHEEKLIKRREPNHKAIAIWQRVEGIWAAKIPFPQEEFDFDEITKGELHEMWEIK